MRNIAGKRALVTGAVGGIGRAICFELANRGAELVLIDVSATGLEQLASELRDQNRIVSIFECDLLQGDDIDRVLNAVLEEGPIDILINNAGVGHYGMMVNMQQQQWDQVMGVNLLAPIRIVNRLLPVLAARPESHIVNMASMLGLCGISRLTAYCTSKAALIVFSESLRAECGKNGVGVSVVCPGFVWTKFFGGFSHDAARREVPTPPRWICTTPEKVARKVMRSIRRNRRLALATPLAHLIYYVRRLAPGLLIALQRISRKRRSPATAAVAKSSQRKAA